LRNPRGGRQQQIIGWRLDRNVLWTGGLRWRRVKQRYFSRHLVCRPDTGHAAFFTVPWRMFVRADRGLVITTTALFWTGPALARRQTWAIYWRVVFLQFAQIIARRDFLAPCTVFLALSGTGSLATGIIVF